MFQYEEEYAANNKKYSAHAKWGLKSDIKSEISGGGQPCVPVSDKWNFPGLYLTWKELMSAKGKYPKRSYWSVNSDAAV